ncbi:MAG: hypothetical protein MZV63_27410 [Marinilabiliales bacterium]|nr:hypothetical protein [Marinilabiliales bacterium]
MRRDLRTRSSRLSHRHLFSGITFRSVGPAWASGRIADLAVNPCNHSEIYAAVASGNIWKSVNNGTTWQPVFDKYGAYAIGCIVIDPNNHNVVWAGTGENNHQRALGWGDGVYRSDDAGAQLEEHGAEGVTADRQVSPSIPATVM